MSEPESGCGSGSGSGSGSGCRNRNRSGNRSRNADAARQIRRAADSVPKDLAECRKRLEGDRIHCWGVAAGSAEEVRTALQVAVAWGDLSDAEVREALQILDRLIAICWRLTH